MKKILGIDLGTNSIGWALVERDSENKKGKILGIGSRIIPMDAGMIGKFAEGGSVSQTAERTGFRGTRRLYERHHLRRERLNRVLNMLGFLPEHYANDIDFEKRLGKFKDETETKLVWKKNQEGKFSFLFQSSFNEMITEFKANGHNIKISYDWTIYYLRKKALTQKIEKEELAWIILNFNQKRGYYQLRGEEEDEIKNKSVEFHSLKVIKVEVDSEPNKKGDLWYSLHLENGWIYRRSSKVPLFDWENKTRDFIVTTDLYDDGAVKLDKEGNAKRSFRAPSEDDWALIKKKTENDIDKSSKTVGKYIYDNLLKNPNQKIKGKLVRTIERKFYKAELKAILEKQIELQPNLFTEEKLADCIRELYKNNNSHQNLLLAKDFTHLFINDIIFYQRPLKSQKSNISHCSLEFHTYKFKDEKEITIERKEYLKVIPKSHPLYQEFRVWQWLYNLKIYKKDDDTDVTNEFIKSQNDITDLFDFLMSQKEVNHKAVLKSLLEKNGLKGKALTNEISKYSWNYVYDDIKDESKKYPMNETRFEIRKRLTEIADLSENFLTKEIEYQLWHIIYSVTDKIEYAKALNTFAEKHSLNTTDFVENFIRIKPYKSEYGAYSEKAIKKLLALMRIGKYWNEDEIVMNSERYFNNIHKLLEKLNKKAESISEEAKEKWNKSINKNLYKELSNFLDADVALFQGLRLHIAQYLVYGRHSETETTNKFETINDINEFINSFKQHSLRNPIVEQIILETLRIVKDIWKQYGNEADNFFDEIHIELGREMKNTAEERKKITNKNIEQEATNMRIKLFLTELSKDKNITAVRPHSPIQQEILKIYEDGVLKSGIEIPEDILKISNTAQPTSSDFARYKLWLEQKYKSPYTGQIIPLSKLFTTDYQIEHILPQARYFDDSFINKVICESEINNLKDKQLGLEFIKNHGGGTVELNLGQKVKILTEAQYTEFVKENYKNNTSKRNRLLMDEIPEVMISRQMNDTRYISKYISNILSNIVRSNQNDDGINSKNLIPVNGKITTRLKQDWGLNDVWNELILPRFIRMNELTNSTNFTSTNTNGKLIPTVPLELSKGFQKKRIDHRHHAMDALVIACATKEHVNLLNNQSANAKNERIDLQRILRNTEIWKDANGKERIKFVDFKKPWQNFTTDAKEELENIVVSFKQNIRVINKATNTYEKYENGEKVKIKQKGTNWAIRKPMHKKFVYAKIDLPWVKTTKKEILTAIRKPLDTSFDLKKIESSITDTGIQKILTNYLKSKGNNPELAFSPEGIEDMNKSISLYNNGKFHQPIYKVRVFEKGTGRFAVGQIGNKKTKYVEAEKGTNLFFAIYQDDNGKRSFETIPLNEVIERQKQGLSSVPELDSDGNKLLFSLSPNDLVYINNNYDLVNNLSQVDIAKIYKVVSFTNNRLYVIPYQVASAIVDKTEYTSLNKIELTKEKSFIEKLKFDRLGNISKW